MRNNIVAILCETAVSAGFAALRFNFRGVGASQGSHDKGRGERQDVAAARKYLRSQPEIDATRVGLAGYSFGAAMAVLSVDDGTRALIAVSTPTGSGAITQVDAACPTLLVSGDRDEYSDPDALRLLAQPLGNNAEVVILPGVDHFWWGSDDRLSEIVSKFLTATLAPAAQPSI